MTTLLTPSIIAKESLMVLENELVFGGLVHRDYSKEFQQVGSTVTIRIPTTFSSTAVSDTVSENTITESSVNVVLDQHLDITFNVTTQELSLDIVDFSEQLIQPAMRAHAQKVDELLAGLYIDVPACGTVTGTAAIADVLLARRALNDNKAPMQGRNFVVAPRTEAALLGIESFLTAEKRGVTQAIKDANMGRVLGFDFYMDQNIQTHTTAEADVSVVGTGAWAVGATTGTVDACQTGGTYEKGAVIYCVGHTATNYYVLTAPCTATDATCIFSWAPALKEGLVDNGTVYVNAQATSHLANLAFHKHAFALVTAPLAPPLGGARAGILNYKGLSCRVVYDYTMMTKKNLISIDMLCGVKTLNRTLATRLMDTNS